MKGQIDTEKSDYTVGKIKIEVRFAKVAAIRWGGLVGEAPDREYWFRHCVTFLFQ